MTITRVSRVPIVPQRVRRIGQDSFAFVPHRFLRDGFLCSLDPDERGLYLFLVLAADRNGLSFYGYDRICAALGLTVEQYVEARNGLIDKDLLAFDGRRFPVRSLPEEPLVPLGSALRSRAELEDHDPATIRLLIDASLASR
jgi:hypothetical protein